MNVNEAAILFDIDGTLMYGRGVGRGAFSTAFSRAYGVEYPAMDSLSFVGATDLGVVRKMAAECGCASTPAREELFFFEMAYALDRAMTELPPERFPGVPAFLRGLVDAGAVLGLVTGNIRSTAWSKVRHIGVDGCFCFGGYGDEFVERNQIARAAEQRIPAGWRAALLVGDTPRDIEAGHSLGVPVLAVGTGWITTDALAAAGADATLEDFSDTERALEVVCELVGRV